MEEFKKGFYNAGAAGAVVVFFILLFVFAKWGPSLPFSVYSQTKGEPFVVSGEGKVFVTPDIAKVTFGIEESGPSLKSVQSSVNKKSQTLTDALKKLGISDSDIKTTSYNVSPQYDYTNPESRITGFNVSTSYEATIRDFDKVNDALTAGVAAGANIVGGVNFEVNDKTQKEKMNEARKMAVADAKDKANGLASAAGITLGKVINVAESGGFPRPLPMMELSAGGAGGIAKTVPAPAVQPGQTEIDVTVSLSYEVR